MFKTYNNLNFITSLRAIAVLLVFLIHSGGLGLREINLTFNRFVDWEKYGVIVFFVISGFTIYSQIISHIMSFKKFILIRFFRLIIPYWPILIILIVFPSMYTSAWSEVYPTSFPYINWITHFFLINFVDLSYINTMIGVEWTLSIEFICYFLFGILITNKKIRNNIYLFTILFSFISYYLINIILNNFNFEDFLIFHWSAIPYIYMFALGGFSFLIRKKSEEFFSENVLGRLSDYIGFMLIIIFLLNLNYMFIRNIEMFFAIETCIALIFLRDNSILGIILVNPLLLFIGSISYSFYLLHFIILNMNIEIHMIFKFLTIILLSFVWFYIFEKKIYNNLKKKVLNDK